MAFSHSFSATGKSPTFYAGRGGFDFAVNRPGAETIAITLEQEIGGNWFTKGSAVSTSVNTRINPIEDYTPSGRFRLSCDTFDTSAIVVDVEGDVFGDAVTASLGGVIPDAWLLEDGEQWLLETGETWLLENA